MSNRNKSESSPNLLRHPELRDMAFFGVGALAAVSAAISIETAYDYFVQPEVIGTVIEPAKNNDSTLKIAEVAVNKLAEQYDIPAYVIRDVTEESNAIGSQLDPNDFLEVDLEKDFSGVYSVEIDRIEGPLGPAAIATYHPK
jgi:hypothetical protein